MDVRKNKTMLGATKMTKTFEEKIKIVKKDMLSGDYWSESSVEQMVKKWTDNNNARISDSRISSQFENYYNSIETE